VTVGEEADHEPFDEILLTDHDVADFFQQGRHKGAGLLHFGIDGTDSCIHGHIINAEWTMPAASLFSF
jgi:hypothetical protein